MSPEPIQEARRQAEICNACRYCEGFCSVFPALQASRAFSDGDIMQLASLCHDCRGCYYSCQYTAPHEFDLNFPRALAEVRQDSWRSLAWPRAAGALFENSGLAAAAGIASAFAVLLSLAAGFRPAGGEGFYSYMSHGLMVAVFAPAFLLPLLALAVSIRSYWRKAGGGRVTAADIMEALRSAARMKNLEGGHGDGCNFEDADRFSHARRYAHQATLLGFLLCFGSTVSGTIMHYVFGLVAPYGPFSPPKLFGVPGGLLLCAGTAALAWLKLRADPAPGAPAAQGGDMAFILILFLSGASGLALYGAAGTGAEAWLLPIHLAVVLTFFLLTPYSKMVHGFYRLAALTKDASRRRAQKETPP